MSAVVISINHLSVVGLKILEYIRVVLDDGQFIWLIKRYITDGEFRVAFLGYDVKTFTETPAAQSTLCCPSERQMEQFWLKLGHKLSTFKHTVWIILVFLRTDSRWFDCCRSLVRYSTSLNVEAPTSLSNDLASWINYWWKKLGVFHFLGIHF